MTAPWRLIEAITHRSPAASNVAGPSRDPHLYDMPDRAATEYLERLPRISLTTPR